MTQLSIPCAIYRGGTSRGLFFNKRDLPEEHKLQEKIFMQGIDAYNLSQIDGLGSGTSHTSKVCVISEPSLEKADIDFTFYQIGIGKELVDGKGTCGNLMAAVGAFAIDEGIVHYDQSASNVCVCVYNTNINKLLHINVPIVNGKAKVTGDYTIPGVIQSGAKYSVNILNPGGGQTGQTLPLGNQYLIKTSLKEYNISFVDVINPFVFVSSSQLELKGTEPNSQLTGNKQLLNELEEIRVNAAVAAGMSKSVQEARKTGSIPKISIVTNPQDYITSEGRVIQEENVDVVAKMVSMGNFHRTFAASGLYCLAAAILLPNTIPNLHSKIINNNKENTLRIGHPEGIVEVKAGLTEENQDVSFVGLDRTVRRIMKGELFYS